MARMKKTVALLLFLTGGTAFATSTLDIGTDYRLRGISENHTDYGLTSDQNYAYYSQRALAHIGGKFSPNIEFMTQFQALGVAGSSASITNPAVNPAGNRYPNTNFTPWIQTAYMKASHLYDTPISLTVGRQPMTLGDGLILSDDDLGFTGIRAESALPWYDLQGQIFTFKAADGLVGTNNSDIYGAEVTKPLHNTRIQFAVVSERDTTGTTTFIRPSENASPNSAQFQSLFPNSTPQQFAQMFNFAATQITRTFFDARVETRLAQGGFIKAEAALQNGTVSRDPSLGTSTATALGFSPDVKLGGYAFLVSGGLFTRFSKYGPIEIHGLFGIASGDSGGGTDSALSSLRLDINMMVWNGAVSVYFTAPPFILRCLRTATALPPPVQAFRGFLKEHQGCA